MLLDAMEHPGKYPVTIRVSGYAVRLTPDEEHGRDVITRTFRRPCNGFD